MPSRMPSVVLKYVPLLEREFRARKQPVGPSWRLDETYVRVKGSWKYVYRAVDKAGQQKCTQLLTGRAHRPYRRQTVTDQIAHRFVRHIRHPDGGQQAATVQDRQTGSEGPLV
jgi:transposase-like protein